MKHYSLSDAINKGEGLTFTQVQGLIDLLGKGLRKKTKEDLAHRLMFSSVLPDYGIFRRVILEASDQPERGVFYIAGQSYPDEIRTVRELILKG